MEGIELGEWHAIGCEVAAMCGGGNRGGRRRKRGKRRLFSPDWPITTNQYLPTFTQTMPSTVRSSINIHKYNLGMPAAGSAVALVVQNAPRLIELDRNVNCPASPAPSLNSAPPIRSSYPILTGKGRRPFPTSQGHSILCDEWSCTALRKKRPLSRLKSMLTPSQLNQSDHFLGMSLGRSSGRLDCSNHQPEAQLPISTFGFASSTMWSTPRQLLNLQRACYTAPPRVERSQRVLRLWLRSPL